MGTLVAVVEDDASLRVAIERLLRGAGWSCVGYASAEDFAARRDGAAPDCAIVDIHLGATNGLALQARLEKSAPTLPVIIVTAHDQALLRRQAVEQGCAAYLVKPFDGATLVDAVRAALAWR